MSKCLKFQQNVKIFKNSKKCQNFKKIVIKCQH